MKARRKPRRALVALPDDKAQTLRDTINNGLGNIGILAAFMCALALERTRENLPDNLSSFSLSPRCALANAIYTSPPEDPRCFGHIGVTYILVIEWVAMALFFISMLTSVVLASDLDGVPNDRRVELARRATPRRREPLSRAANAFERDFFMASFFAPRG